MGPLMPLFGLHVFQNQGGWCAFLLLTPIAISGCWDRVSIPDSLTYEARTKRYRHVVNYQTELANLAGVCRLREGRGWVTACEMHSHTNNIVSCKLIAKCPSKLI